MSGRQFEPMRPIAASFLSAALTPALVAGLRRFDVDQLRPLQERHDPQGSSRMQFDMLRRSALRPD